MWYVVTYLHLCEYQHRCEQNYKSFDVTASFLLEFSTKTHSIISSSSSSGFCWQYSPSTSVCYNGMIDLTARGCSRLITWCGISFDTLVPCMELSNDELPWEIIITMLLSSCQDILCIAAGCSLFFFPSLFVFHAIQSLSFQLITCYPVPTLLEWRRLLT